MTLIKKRVFVYIDGFNLYHAVNNLKSSHLKWLNLRSLTEKFIDNSVEFIDHIYYFSAQANHIEDCAKLRHNIYISALKAFNVDYIKGHFKKKQLIYRNDRIKVEWERYEEKETDVNIAVYMVRDAISNSCDKILLITNDTDIAPALKMIKELNPNIKLKILTPPEYKMHYTLKEITKQKKPTCILRQHLELSLLPERIVFPNGKIITVPDKYKKPCVI